MKIFILILLVLVWGCLPVIKTWAQTGANETSKDQDNIYAFIMKGIDQRDIPLSQFQGKALLIVNTASRCGFTGQYANLEKLYEQYHSKGFEILAFPANNFMNQEPGSDASIKEFCSLKFKTTFLLFAKSSVRGADINPLYKYLTSQAGFSGPIKWNFNKFLVDTKGKVIARFDSKVDPLSPQVIQALEAALPKH